MPAQMNGYLAQMQKQLSQLPPEQRQMAEQMMQRTQGSAAAASVPALPASLRFRVNPSRTGRLTRFAAEAVTFRKAIYAYTLA